MDTRGSSRPSNQQSGKYLAAGFIKRYLDEGFLCHRKGYDFLLNPFEWVPLLFDDTVIPEATSYAAEGSTFVARTYDMTGGCRSLRKLLDITEATYENLTFEKIIGIGRRLGEDMIYHTLSPGVTLDRVGQDTPSALAEAIVQLLARAMRELHAHGLQYSDAVPTNFRYDLGSKIILNPHNCIIEIAEDTRGQIQVEEDLAILLATHSYITNREAFIAHYCQSSAIDQKRLLRRVTRFAEEVPHLVDTAEIPLARVWAYSRAGSRTQKSG